jgi:hypothetical protein
VPEGHQEHGRIPRAIAVIGAAALISRSTSFSVRCSRVLRVLLGKRRGTVGFRLVGAARLRCTFGMEIFQPTA